MKYLHLEEVRNKYWQELAATEGNFANVLIAMEVAYELAPTVSDNQLEATAAWADVMDDAKTIIRNVYKEVVGFNVHEVLEQTRLIYIYRNFNSRTTISNLYGESIHGTEGISVNEEADPQVIMQGREAAERALNIKMPSIRYFTGTHNTIEFDRLVKQCIDELDGIIAEREYGNGNARDMQSVMDTAIVIIHKYLYLIAITNTFNFKAYDESLVRVYLNDMFTTLAVPLEKREALMRACIELVE